jgi:hypothetical protein
MGMKNTQIAQPFLAWVPTPKSVQNAPIFTSLTMKIPLFS